MSVKAAIITCNVIGGLLILAAALANDAEWELDLVITFGIMGALMFVGAWLISYAYRYEERRDDWFK